jgi:hypothetical protein
MLCILVLEHHATCVVWVGVGGGRTACCHTSEESSVLFLLLTE